MTSSKYFKPLTISSVTAVVVLALVQMKYGGVGLTSSAPGLVRWTAFLALITPVLICWLWLRSLRSDQAWSTHGSAGWAGREDVRDLLQPAGESLESGALLLAPYARNQELVLSPTLASRHILLVGGSGSGKSRGLLMPNAERVTHSFIATDPKGELYDLTSGYRRRAWRFAPRDPDASRCLNWIPLCRDGYVAGMLAGALLQSERDTDPFWRNADLALCTAVFCHAAFSDEPTPTTAHNLLQLPPDQLLKELADSPSPTARSAGRTLAMVKPELIASVFLSVTNKLRFMEDPDIRRFISASTTPPDFTELRRRAIALYWVLHERDISMLRGLSSLSSHCS